MKKLISIIISIIISVKFFDSDIWMMLILFCFFNMISISSKEQIADWKKTKRYHLFLLLCIVGGIVLLLGKEVFQNQGMIIFGAMMFSTTFAAIIIKDFVEYFNLYHRKH